MGVTKISPETQALSLNNFLQVDAELEPIKAPVETENEDTGSDFSKEAALLSLKDLTPAASIEKPDIEKDIDNLPLLQKLLLQLEMIIPILIKLEHGQKLTQQEEMDLMSSFSESKINSIYFGGVLSFGGSMLGAAVSVLAGKEAGQLTQGVIQGISSLAEGSRENASSKYTREQMKYQEVGDVRKGAERLYATLMDAVNRADSLGHLKM
ncbi:MAG: hypothetical protein V4494_02500 [Chlamydiota bacterium]